MRLETLDLLRCPFCGVRLSVVENAALERDRQRLESGVLGCECCAFPVVAGIPVLIADDAARGAMRALEAGRRDEALHRLLGLEGARRAAFVERTAGARPPTYRDLLPLLCPDAEADYFLYRFSDPTFLLVEALLDVLGRGVRPAAAGRTRTPGRTRAQAGTGTAPPEEIHASRLELARPRAAAGTGTDPDPGHAAAAAGRALDLCGGSGHLTRVLLRQPACAGAVVADVRFWKLWLAARIVAPECEPVCCDANSPLPFADDRFATVLLNDAFHYVWHKRLLAGEMRRVATRDGLIVMPHLHSAHGENHSAGNTLSPAAYRDLFAALEPRLFDDRRLLDDLLERRVVDLARDIPPDACRDTPSITLVAGRNAAPYRRHDVPDRLDVTGVLAVNPLYRAERAGGVSRLTLGFPSPEYEDEFALAKRYLPASVTVAADLAGAVTPAEVGPGYAGLRRRRVLLDLPRRYC